MFAPASPSLWGWLSCSWLTITKPLKPLVSLPQSFPSDEGWPFAKYLGACGRVVAVNYVGEELWSFYNAPWEKRVDLARQLMDIAEQLTNNDFEFALYLLDVSFDNFAVGPRDGKVIIVDAENVLVADKRLIKQSKWLHTPNVAMVLPFFLFFPPHVNSSFGPAVLEMIRNYSALLERCIERLKEIGLVNF